MREDSIPLKHPALFLRADDESNNDAVARCAEEALAAGPMASTLRVADYIAFLDAYAGKGKAIKGTATSCAMFAGACLIHAGALPPRPPPKARGITTWLGVPGFIGSWIPEALLGADGVQRGDVWYICSERGSMPLGDGRVYTWTTWPAAANGHVGIARANGWIVPTAEGGGSPGGTGCRLSATAKDLRKMGRGFRGVWRPDRMPALKREPADTEPAPPPSSQPPPVWVPPSAIGLKRNDYSDTVRVWQMRLAAAGHKLPKSTRADGSFDGDFGAETERATLAVQRENLLPQTGVVDRVTWEKAVRK